LDNTSNVAKGLLYAWVACIFWSTLYIDTTFIAPYGTADLASVRFFLSALIAIAILLANGRVRVICNELKFQQFVLAGELGFLGFTGFYFFLATAIKYTSEIIAVAIVGLISVVTLLANNYIYREFKWRAVICPAVLGGMGVAAIIYSQVPATDFAITASSWRLWVGIGAAFVALMMWSAYQILNKLALKRLSSISKISSEDWTLLTLIGGAMALPFLLALLPVSPLSREFVLFSTRLDGSIMPLLAWGLFLALGASLLSLHAWNTSQVYLPPTLSGQAIVFLLPIVFALGWLHGRFTDHPAGTCLGIALLMTSIIWTVLLEHPPTWLPKILKLKIHGLRRERP